jgi:hypothetical protein
MTNAEQVVLNRLNADNWAELYRCRWSQPDAERVVPQLERLLKSEDLQIKNEALRALFRIGPSAVSAAAAVAKLIGSGGDPLTKQLAVLTLGQIAHKVPSLCVHPLASALSDPSCCQDAMRTLAIIGSKATDALERVLQRYNDPNAKIRKATVVTAAAIDATHPEVMRLMRKASSDRSKIVREAVAKCSRKGKKGTERIRL